jgi:hypothetical protein
MYSLNLPVSAIRTKVRQEFEKHRYVSQLQVVDVLLYQSHSEFQVSHNTPCKDSYIGHFILHLELCIPCLLTSSIYDEKLTYFARKPSTTGNSSPT